MQGFFMILVTLAPFIDGHWSFELLIPKSIHSIAAHIIGISGTSICLLAVRTMGKSFTIKAMPQHQAGLITTGPFKWTRNPMYFGGLLMEVAWAVMFSSGLAITLTCGLALVLYFKILIEEQNLIEMYGESYRLYKLKTKRLIPFVC